MGGEGILKYGPNIGFFTRPVIKENISPESNAKLIKNKKRQNTVSMNPRATFFNMRFEIHIIGIPKKI